MSNSFGENIRNYRNSNRLTQSEFADLVAKILSKKNECDFVKSVTNWENGNSYPKNMEVVLAIAELMKVTLDDLFHKEIDDFKNNCTVCSKRFERLSDPDIKLLCYIVQDLYIHVFEDDKGEPYDVFQSLVFLKTEKREKTTTIILKNEDISFEKEFANIEFNEFDKCGKSCIDKLMQGDILKNLFRQNFVVDVNTYNCTDSEGYVAEIDLNLSEKEIEELFIEYATRKAADIIYRANEK